MVKFSASTSVQEQRPRVLTTFSTQAKGERNACHSLCRKHNFMKRIVVPELSAWGNADIATMLCFFVHSSIVKQDAMLRSDREEVYQCIMMMGGQNG
ncbi:hypothetical protein HOLleu_06702 [Holothuria leucospilota]|uniref:Uncharacterized protein n=1 Tax=Holothuria leucospilota TaxID=206669 RepID=A0A9Q1HFB9_HOLLE|nr:hypothetical protein HOLleu_06702 [Holothuria leucospilota]